MASHVLIKINYPGAPPQQVWSLVDSYSEQLVSSKVISAAVQEGSSSGEGKKKLAFSEIGMNYTNQPKLVYANVPKLVHFN